MVSTHQSNMTPLFTLPDVWSGGHFELVVDLGHRNDDLLRRALVALWTHPALEGCYLKRDVEPANQPKLDPLRSALPLESQLFGIVHLPNGTRLACLSFTVRFDDGPDWLGFALPMEALSYAYPIGAYPFEDGTPLGWRNEVNEWLREIGKSVFQAAHFRRGIIGHEATDTFGDEDFTQGIPNERWDGHLIPQNGTLRWYPPTEGAPHTITHTL